MWTKNGDFEKIYHQPELTKLVSYKNTHRESIVKTVDLCGYCNGQFQIIVQSFDSFKHSALKEALIERGFEKPNFSDDMFNMIRIMDDDLVLLAQFLKVITQIDPDFFDIEKEIFRMLKIDTKPPAKVVSMTLSNTAQIKQPREAKDSRAYAPVVIRRSSSLTDNFKAKAKL